jgi:hypothetical protein
MKKYPPIGKKGSIFLVEKCIPTNEYEADA